MELSHDLGTDIASTLEKHGKILIDNDFLFFMKANIPIQEQTDRPARREEISAMKVVIFTLAALLLWMSQISMAAGPSDYAIAFSQEVMAIAADGTPYPSKNIDPAKIKGMREYPFDLGQGRSFLVKSNIRNPEQRGLPQLAEQVTRCVHYVEQATGRTLDQGILLYLIEFDTLPLSYSFEATYPTQDNWGQVRLALIKSGAPLTGPNAPAELSELLLDTLPHELGHDLLATIPALLHDIDGQASNHTRWFIDGVCELLAKGFASQEDAEEYRRFLAIRKVTTVLSDPEVRSAVYQWGQDNNNQMGLESDLYGASLLLLMAWTEEVELPALLQTLDQPGLTFRGPELLALMQSMTGQDSRQAIVRAEQIGKSFDSEGLFASRRATRSRLGG